ncbi:putative bifunctional diguanylate cyclase/phosphodiesterase [Peribacillus kribbensis]|uniref:putative bifunctional diguanylate cyclase/phosphodiesterase n=1 Tax=Peribacillus kribbensis TaxID=356658 RepID=UPI000402C5DA|nr:EAL domain-containing protein [Peribacillus kribbensis]
MNSSFFSNFNLFDYRYVLMTIVLSIISCIIGIEISRRVKLQAVGSGFLLKGAFYLAVTFWLTHFFVSYSFDISFSTNNYKLYSLFNFLFSFTGCVIALKMAQFKVINEKYFILGSIAVAVSILGADTLGFLVLFKHSLEWKPVFSMITVILVLGTSFSIFRFLNQFTNEEHYPFIQKWKYIGCITAGAALSGIPYIVIVSMINLDPIHPSFSEELIPFAFVMLANVVLNLVPDLFGDKLLLKNVESYKSLFNHNPSAVFSVGLNGIILNVNDEGAKITGVPKEQLPGMYISSFFANGMSKEVKDYLEHGNQTNIETEITDFNGKKKSIRITAVRTVIDQKVVGAFGIAEDITDKRKAEKQVEFMAYHDELTTLPNRRMMKKVMSRTAEENHPFRIMLMDFDRFKRINDTFGHSFGDKLLIEIGKRLTAVVQQDGTVARLGGDEFLIITSNFSFTLAEKIIEEFRKPMMINGYEVIMTASMGIASFPDDTRNMDDLYKYADIAMYQSKENGANGYSVYNKKMADIEIDKLKIENDLIKAIEENKLMLYFQPKYNIISNSLVGSEVLLRWKHKEKGFIPPDVFIPIAEESGLIVRLERFVVSEVCIKLNEWKKEKREIQRVSINISLITILQEGFADFILENISKFGLNGSMLELEITERIVMENEEEVNATLQKLREYGLSVSIDDFGTGYSSLRYLDKLHVDILKIDRTFVNNLHNRKEVVSAIIFLAKSLNLKVIAEGVETSDQIELLKVSVVMRSRDIIFLLRSLSTNLKHSIWTPPESEYNWMLMGRFLRRIESFSGEII